VAEKKIVGSEALHCPPLLEEMQSGQLMAVSDKPMYLLILVHRAKHSKFGMERYHVYFYLNGSSLLKLSS
jgi:hypothetical protein